MVILSRFFFAFAALCIPANMVRKEGIEELISIRLYSNGNSSNFQETLIGQALPLLETSEEFDCTKPLVLLIHGMHMNAHSGTMRGLVDAFGKSKKSKLYNVLSMNMPKLFKLVKSKTFVMGAMKNAKRSGNIIGSFLCDAINQGMTSADKINLIGYSMGAQAAGYAARVVKRTHGLVNYIGGLDPAGLAFFNQNSHSIGFLHVSRDDALTTHLVHTTNLYYASMLYSGTADFVFNNGMLQPGCFNNSTGCSHTRAILYFTEVILGDSVVLGRKCTSWTRFHACLCEGRSTARLSFPPDTSVKGVHYLRTDSKRPFALGPQGSHCYPRILWNSIFGTPCSGHSKGVSSPSLDNGSTSDDDETYDNCIDITS